MGNDCIVSCKVSIILYCIIYDICFFRKNFRLFCFNSSRTVPIPQTPSERLRAFIFVLAVADFLVLLTIPLSLYHILSGSWPFGQPICKIHTAIDRGGKLFSVVILTAMSLQRYLVVCTKWRYIASTIKTIFIPILSGIIACVLIPILWENRYTRVLLINFKVSIRRHMMINYTRKIEFLYSQ